MKFLKIFGTIIVVLIIILIILFLFTKYRIDNIKDKGDLAKLIDFEAQKFVDNGNSNGIIVGVVKNGDIYIKGYGTIKKGENILPDSSTIFELASTSKLFTTSVLQILSDKNEMNKHETLSSVFKNQISIPDVAKNTTLENLATHTSGFPSIPNSFLKKMTDTTNPYKGLETQDIYEYLINCEGKNKEGTFEYSNFGMGLLGHILELKTGKKYEQIVQEQLLTTLGMRSTFITVDSHYQSRISQGYNEHDQPTPIWIDNVLTGAGSFLSSGEDMVKFIKANLYEDYSPISKSLINSQKKIENTDNGLGWLYTDWMDKFMGNENIIWHNGMAGGYASFIAIDSVNKYGIVVLSNKSYDVTYLGMKLAYYTKTQSWKNKNGI